jgi:hypothetical protein
MQRSCTAASVLMVLIAGLACNGSMAGPDEAQVTPRAATFVDALKQRGATVQSMERLSPQAYCLSVGPQRLVVNSENVYAFTYDSDAAASADASAISPDASSITAGGQACRPGWTGPPRFYRQDRLIVLYVGTNQELIRTLDAILGNPFAFRGP